MELTRLPFEILTKIFYYLNTDELYTLMTTNITIYYIINMIFIEKLKNVKKIDDYKYRIYINEKLNDNFNNIYVKHINIIKDFIIIKNIKKYVISLKYDSATINSGITENVERTFNIMKNNINIYCKSAIIYNDLVEYIDIIKIKTEVVK